MSPLTSWLLLAHLAVLGIALRCIVGLVRERRDRWPHNVDRMIGGGW